MAIRPLEKISSGTGNYYITPRDDALSHHISTCGKSGSLNLKEIKISDDRLQLICPSQTLQVHGYRLCITGDTAIATVNASGNFTLVLKVTAYDGKDASYEFTQNPASYSPQNDSIEETDGVAEMILCRFEVTNGLIVSCSTIMRQLRSSEVKLGDESGMAW